MGHFCYLLKSSGTFHRIIFKIGVSFGISLYIGTKWSWVGPFRKRGVFNELTWFPRIPFSCFMQKLRFKTISDIFVLSCVLIFCFSLFNKKMNFNCENLIQIVFQISIETIEVFCLETTSPKSKIECSHFTDFFGLFPLLGRFAFNIFKKWICPISLALIGLFGKKTKQTLRLDCRFVIWSKESGQFLPNIISQKYDLAFPNQTEQVHSPQNDDKNNTNFRRRCQREMEKC